MPDPVPSSSPPARDTLSPGEAAVVTALCFGLFIWWSLTAVLSGFPRAEFSDSGAVWSIGFEVVLALLALSFLRRRGFDIASLYPEPTAAGTLIGVGLFFAAWVVGAIAVAPFIDTTKPQMTDFSFDQASLAWTVVFALVNGAFEEVFLLGVLVRGLRGYGLSIAVGLPLLVRVSYHLYQGPIGAIWILAFGLTFSAVYLRHPKLWPAVFAHVLWDIVPFVMAGVH